jgi:hypothetical protein
MNTPLFQDILGLSPVSLHKWFQLFCLASIVLFAVEIFKLFRSKPEYHAETMNTQRR